MRIQCLKFLYNDNQYVSRIDIEIFCGIKIESIRDLNKKNNLQKKSIKHFSFAVIVC